MWCDDGVSHSRCPILDLKNRFEVSRSNRPGSDSQTELEGCTKGTLNVRPL